MPTSNPVAPPEVCELPYDGVLAMVLMIEGLLTAAASIATRIMKRLLCPMALII